MTHKQINFTKVAETLQAIIPQVRYEYCTPERVSESVMSEHISQIITDVRAMSVEELSEKIEWEFKSPNSANQDKIECLMEEGEQDVNMAAAKAVVCDICCGVVTEMSYQTITFIID